MKVLGTNDLKIVLIKNNNNNNNVYSPEQFRVYCIKSLWYIRQSLSKNCTPIVRFLLRWVGDNKNQKVFSLNK